MRTKKNKEKCLSTRKSGVGGSGWSSCQGNRMGLMRLLDWLESPENLSPHGTVVRPGKVGGGLGRLVALLERVGCWGLT